MVWMHGVMHGDGWVIVWMDDGIDGWCDGWMV